MPLKWTDTKKARDGPRCWREVRRIQSTGDQPRSAEEERERAFVLYSTACTRLKRARSRPRIPHKKRCFRHVLSTRFCTDRWKASGAKAEAFFLSLPVLLQGVLCVRACLTPPAKSISLASDHTLSLRTCCTPNGKPRRTRSEGPQTTLRLQHTRRVMIAFRHSLLDTNQSSLIRLSISRGAAHGGSGE